MRGSSLGTSAAGEKSGFFAMVKGLLGILGLSARFTAGGGPLAAAASLEVPDLFSVGFVARAGPRSGASEIAE